MTTMGELDVFCPECGSQIDFLEPSGDPEREVECGNCGEKMAIGECRTNLAAIWPPYDKD